MMNIQTAPDFTYVCLPILQFLKLFYLQSNFFLQAKFFVELPNRSDNEIKDIPEEIEFVKY